MMLSTGFSIITLLLSWTALCESSVSNECLDRFMDISLLEHRAGSIGTNRIGGRMRDGRKRIVASIVFNCSTSINSVILGVDIRDRNSFPSFQIWRPTGGNGYMLEDERLIVYTPANVSRTGVYEYPLVPPIDVLAGDLIALSQPTMTAVRLYYIENIAFDSYEFNNLAATTVTLSPDDVINDQLLLVYPMTAQPNCVNSPFSAQYIIDQSLLITDARIRGDRRQFIYPDMKFRCNGTINKWIFGGLAMSGSNQPELQVWRRQTGTDDTYTRHAFTPVTANVETAIGSNVYEYILDTPVEFMEEDVFGMFQPDTGSNFDLYAQRESGPENYRMAGNVNDPSNNLMLSELEIVENDYPLVSLEISISTQEISTSTMILSTTSILTTIVTEIAATATVITVTINETRLTGSQPAVTSSQPAVVIMTTSTTASLSDGVSSVNVTSQSAAINDSGSPVVTDTNDPFSKDRSNFIGAMVAVSLLILTIIVCTTIVVVIILWRKKMVNNYSLPKDTTDQSLANPIYRVNTEFHSQSGRNASILASKPDVNQSYELGRYDKDALYSEINEHQNVHYGQYSHMQWNIVVPTLGQRRAISENFSDFRDAVSSIYSIAGKGSEDDYHLLESDQASFFEESNIYWAPGNDYDSLYEQLALRKFREILASQVSMSDMLGSGHFGVVMRGTWESPNGCVPVAIKTMNSSASEEDQLKFLQEAAIMGQFHHPNIVEIHGVVTMEQPVMIVLELMHSGDLHHFLHSLKPSPGEMVGPSVPELLVDFCLQVASAMEYLASKSFIHRDLAARNVLVTEQKICKISDFGMSRDLQEEAYYQSKGGDIPIKWTAPEALQYKKYSTASDVWSFGVLMYEIWSLGEKPFQSFTNQQTFRKVCDGYRLPPPSGCPRAIYELMMNCWHPENSSRPTFSRLTLDLSQPDQNFLLQVPASYGENLHRQARILGASLEAGRNLYLDIQKLYRV